MAITVLDLGRIRPVNKGAWSASTSYVYYDHVSYNGGSYICTASSGSPAGTIPSSSDKWALVAQGSQGVPGPTPNIAVTANTLPAGSSATATRSGTDTNPLITFGIPKGDKGDTGDVTPAATAAKEAAEAAQAAAEDAQEAAETAQASAESAATTATTKASNASTSATQASGSASSAATAAETATTKAGEALSYRNEAATSAGTASTKASEASASASSASSSASTATTKANEAAASASGASGSATTATNKAVEAAASATTATNQATTATTAAGTATTKATEATTAAETATTKAGEASASATTATTQAGIATTKAGEAATSATNAATSATNAATSETNAATSASEAAASAASIPSEASVAETTGMTGTNYISGRRLFSFKNFLETDSAMAKMIHNLAQAQQGKLQETQTDSTSAYTKTVVAGALDYARLTQWGGKSFVWNQLCDNSKSTTTLNGVTFTNNGDGSWTGNGTATGGNATAVVCSFIKTIQGHKYFYCGCPSGGSATTYLVNCNRLGGNDYGDGVIYLAPETVASEAVRIRVANGHSVSNLVFKPMFIDLTQMFGAGNEPATVEAFRAMFPADYYAYTASPEVMSANLVSIYSKGVNLFNKTAVVSGSYIDSTDGSLVSGSSGKNASPLIPVEPSTAYTITAQATDTTGAWYDASQNFISGVTTYGTQTSPAGARYFRFTILDANLNTAQFEKGSSATAYKAYMEYTKTIPTAVTQLTGYGWSAGTAKNEVVWTESKKAFIKSVERVDLGTLTDWLRVQSGDFYYFRRRFTEAVSTRGVNFVCSKFTNSGATALTTLADGQAQMGIEGYSYFRADAYTDVASFTSAMSGVYFYYPLATPVETDISDLLGEDNTLRVEAGGTLTFQNQLTNMKIPIQSTEAYEVSINDAIFQGGS